MLQVVSVVGAIAILGAFAADQFGWVSPSRPSYAVANLVGAGILTVVAVADRQVGFVVLQGTWTMMSLWAVVAILRGGGSGGDGPRPSRVR
ncbi:MAG: hypothetical protein H0X57_14995 [Rubrobacter sp.]|jgi:hypothetical protein|nr:hypothetical protein [Rubrobacter sp.]MDQ3302201.1 hypothetical protein [Actinomycetota bacterium]